MRCFLTLFLSLGSLPGFAKPAQAQSAIEVTSVHFESTVCRLGLNSQKKEHHDGAKTG
jgi:hypothetical protein